jgi:hypothetical protein
MKVIFINPTVERDNPAAPNACSRDFGHDLCIEVEYEVQREAKKFVVISVQAVFSFAAVLLATARLLAQAKRD